jgi:UDPglucose 6-dehydrogenase
MKLSVIGAGYVGLTTAACLAQIGHDVFCSESDLNKLAKLELGLMPFFEPYLEDVITTVRQSARLRFGSTEDAIAWGDAIFICVGTPPLPNGDVDLSSIEGVARTIAKRAVGYKLIIEKSTVPVQTGGRLRKYLSIHATSSLQYDVASNPEVLREGASVEDFLHPDRIVIGVESAGAEYMLRKIYESLIRKQFTCPLHAVCPNRKDSVFLVTDTCSAELIKHASNSFLATKISFINMVADLCEAAGADVTKVAEGMGLDARIGASFLRPGIGFGGFCFPKDLQAFMRIADKFGCDFSLLREVERINQSRSEKFMEKIKRELWVLRGKTIAVWGLAFKPNTDDIRYASSLLIIRHLLKEGAVVKAYDPQAMDKARVELPEIAYCADMYEAVSGAEAIAILTEWDEFRSVEWDRVTSLLDRPLIIDGRNMFSADEVVKHGLQYIGVAGISATPESITSVVSV